MCRGICPSRPASSACWRTACARPCKWGSPTSPRSICCWVSSARATAPRSRCWAAWAPRATTFARRSTTSLGSLAVYAGALVRPRGRSFRQHAQGVRHRSHQEGENGERDPVIGRAAEIERVMQILSRRQKNNPLHLGESRAWARPRLWRALAQLIVANQVPDLFARQTPDHP